MMADPNTNKPVEIQLEVSFQEVAALADFYRNRNLILAQRLREAQLQLQDAQSQLEKALGELGALTADASGASE